MNHVYKTVFNKSTQTWMAVCEYARRVGCGSASGGSKSVTRGVAGLLTFLSFAVLMALQSAHANTPTTIIADKSADKALQPIVLNTASGVVSVNIATPNARGLSNNHYSQFDVGSTGAVLNNNRKAVGTQIAGFVQANPYMARGEASTILNQVNSNHPSHLGGFIEIAGKKADVIIANPSGLVINGAGFINAGHVHLAAANSQVHQGQLTGYEVGTGHIAAHGKLNLQGTDYAALIAKAVQINDEIYAGRQLDVILGENSVHLQDGDFTQLTAINKQTSTSSANQTTNKEQQGATPILALDISNLGGMYAGKIHLVGTDKGFGVNNQGVITATGRGQQLGVGTLTLDSQGNLVNTGKILAKDAVTIGTHGSTTQNNGTLLSEQADIAINTASLNNTGIIHSTQTAKIAAKEAIENRGSVYGGVLQVDTGKLDNTGQLIQTGTGKLDITTDTLINIDKAVIGQSLYGQTSIPTPSAPSSDQSAGSISNQPKDSTAGSTGNLGTDPQPPALSDSGANAQTKPVPNARGHIIATNRIHNTGNQALITATGDIGISANQTSNTKQASIDAQSLNTNTLTNTDSKIALDEMHWQLTSFDNSKGSITAKDGMVIGSESTIINTGGSLTSGTDITLIAKDSIINQDGTMTAVKQADITAKELQNGGAITADTLTITQLADYTHTDQDKLVANRLAFTTSGKLINQSQLTAGQTLTLNANHIDNTQAGIITSGNHTQITSQTDITNQGFHNGDTTIVKANDTINNLAGGRLYGTHLAIQADTLNNTPAKAKDIDTHHTAPVIAARQRLDIGVNHLNNHPNPDRAGKFNDGFDNQALITSLGSLHIGGSLDDNQQATGKAETVVNKGATIESGGEMVVNTKTLLNTNADFKKHTVKVEAESVYGQTLYRNREQSGAAPVIQKSTDVADLGKKPMAGLFDCADGSDCIINYDNDSAIWAYFKIDAPKEPIPDIKAKDLLDEPELPKDETAQSCALAGADNQACVQYNKDLANYTKVMGPLLKWEEDNAAPIEALNLAIREYNRQFTKDKSDVDLALNIYTTDEAYLGPTSRKGAPTGALYVKQANGSYQRVGEEIDEITVDFVVYEDKTLTSDPARMVAGNNLIIHGDTLINDKSQMNAGLGFAVLGDTVIQTPDNGLYGEKTKVTENGRYVSRTVVSSGAGRRHKRIDIGSGAFVQSFAPLATYQLPILNATINTTPSSTGIDKPATGNDVSTIIKDVNDDTITLPTSALYIITADDPNLPLIQTDPAFTDDKQWLSSDYMLKALQSDPNHIHKRLSNGYGEQTRIKDQYYLLTGRHINTDYHSNEEAYKALMDNGITAAKQFGYTLGTALTAEQMANLTTDIVWLVKQSITVATKDKDGNRLSKTQEVLVPKLYLRSANIATGTLTPDGRYSAVSARNIDMQLTGNLDNNGNLIAKDTAAISANNVNNTGTIYGNFVAIKANNDITNHGTMYANSAMGLDAKNRIINQSLTTTQTNTQGRSSSSRTDISQIATISVGTGLKDSTDENGKPLTTLSLRGNQIIYQGATSDNAGGSTQMTAQNGIDIGTVTTSNHISAVADDNDYFSYSQTQDVGSTITSAGNTIIKTTGEYADINIQGSSVQSEGVTALLAQGVGSSILVTEGRTTQSLDTANKITDKGILSKKTTQTAYQMDSDASIQSTVGGETVLMKSGGNTQLTGVEVKATETISIETDGHLIMDAAKDILSTKTSSSENNKWIGATVDKGDYTHTYEQVDAITTTLQAKNISTKSNGSTLLEGTQFHYSDNATVVSGGKLYLQAAISGTSEHTTSNDNYVVWQKTEDSGSIKQTATLPSFVGNNTPTIIALDGVEIQIPISQKEQKAGITLQEQIDTLIQQPEYSYLYQFIDREDTLWQEIILAEESWDYKQEGLTPAGAAIVAIAVGMATGGAASGIAGTVAANVGSQTVGAMAGAAFSSLASQASVSLINNKGDVEATLKELGSKDNVKQLTLAIASAGISHKIDKGLGLKGIDITQTGFDQRLVKAIADSTSTSLLQTAVYGSDFEENLKKNLRVQFTAVATQDTLSNIVKDFDSDTLSDNIAHKIAAGLTGCLSAKAAGNDCDAAAIGAVVGEMWGDWHTDNPNTLTQDEKDKLINQAKLIAGVTAAYAGEDVNVAADMAAEAVRWNTANRRVPTRPYSHQLRRDIIARETISIREVYPEFAGIRSYRRSDTPSQAEVWEYQALGRFVRNSKQTYPDPYQEFRRIYYHGYSDLNPILPNGQRTKITFGGNANQGYHTWRHVNSYNMDMFYVVPIIRRDLHRLNLNSMPINQTERHTVKINGTNLTYSINRRSVDTFNIGRIHDAQQP
ncbi:DUF637 domain-containing protein [Moraxella canis]|uniref:DUF637 domain-containing protein n=3 Tax=Moraxella canis TaxID=90239 RepID=A0ABZ0WX77_9GAMM|nr:DUF637 domain-containing protein [Moraxella canis]